MKSKLIAVVLIVAVLGALLAGCAAAKVKDAAAQKAMDTFVELINGTKSSTTGEWIDDLWLNVDSVDIETMEYITYNYKDETVEGSPEFPVYNYHFVASYSSSNKDYVNQNYYVNVIYRNETYKATLSNEENYERNQKLYKTKDGKFKKGAINKMLAPALELLKKNAAARKAAAEERAAQAERMEQQRTTLRTAADQIYAALTAALEGGNITAATTQQQLVALLPATSETLVYEYEKAEAETPAEPAEGEEQPAAVERTEGVVYVTIPLAPAEGFQAGEYNVTAYIVSGDNVLLMKRGNAFIKQECIGY